MADLRKLSVDNGSGDFAYEPSIPGSQVIVLAAATAAEHAIPTDASSNYAQKVIFSADCDFWVTPLTDDEDEIVVNGTFAADTDWTKGTGWTIATGVASSDASQTGDSDLEQTFAGGLVEGRTYATSVTVSNRTAGNVTVVIGGTEGTDRDTNATHAENIIAGSTDVIALRADADFDGDVDSFTVTPVAVAPATNSTGGAPILNPSTVLLGGKYTKFSLYSTLGGNVNMQFFS